MGREIKFRAWSKKRKKIYEVLILLKETFGDLWAKCKGYDIIDQKDIHIDVQPKDCILMQYIGLKDKNGKEIYEGDIILFDGEPFEVVWCGCSFQAKRLHCNISNLRDMSSRAESRFEVVGNIHEHPELMEVTGE